VVQIHRSFIAHVTQRFDEWREIWRNEDGEQDMKFEHYAKSDPVTARKVHRQLALMALALFDTHAFEEQFGMKPQRFPDRVSFSLLKNPVELTLVGTERSHALPTQRWRESNTRNARHLPRTMQNQHVHHQEVQVSLPT
jgi:hypothetical protein